ncbi:MAG TPA: FecR domain-containing protein [Opitutus sp.]|nr:FecR domain-containing protein [Opitutus sp.]
MRLSKLIPWIVLGVFAFSAAARAQKTAQAPGQIYAVKVTGSVTATNLVDHSQAKLANNDKLSQHYVVTTAAASSVILVFSNGATLNLGADSTLSIDEFLQDPFSEQVKVGDLTEEPTTSSTKLNLSRGELVGNVKHLHEDRGSSFTVNTPVGAAGIRGTTFRIVFRPDPITGNITFTLSTADGSVAFNGTSSTTATGAAASGVHVDTGKEISLTVDATVHADGTITINNPPVIDASTTTQQNIPAATQTAIQNSVQEILTASSPVIINTTGGNPPGGTSTDNTKDGSKDTGTKDTGKQDTTSNPNSTGSDTTPGAGQ